MTITADDADWLAAFTRQLVEDRLAACGNVMHGVRSIYRWEGEVEDDSEVMVTLHTRRSLVDPIIERTKHEHSYDVPQVLATAVVAANPAYHQWVLDQTRSG